MKQMAEVRLVFKWIGCLSNRFLVSLQAQANEGISPFFRQTRPARQYNMRALRQNFQPRAPNRRNYFTHMARKRVMNARRTLDLRQKLINMRVNKSGLDLRFKIVANMIANMRKQTKAFQNNPRFHPYVNRLNGGTTLNQSLRYSIYLHSLFCLGGVVSISGMDRSTVSTIERLVGKLPPWIKNNNDMAQMITRVNPLHKNYQHQVSRAGPVRIHPPALYQPVPMYQTNYITSRQSSCATSPNEFFCDVPYANEVPALDYQVSRAGPVRIHPPALYQPVPVYQTNDITSRQSSSATSPNEFFCDVPYANEVPAFEPIQNVMPPPLVFDPTQNQQRDVPYANEVPPLEPIQNVMPPPLVFDPTQNQQRDVPYANEVPAFEPIQNVMPLPLVFDPTQNQQRDVPYANEVPPLEPIQNFMPPPLVFDPTQNQQRARSLSAGRYRKIIITVKYPKQIKTNL